MNGFLISLASFIVAISVIVTIHEFGHYIVARLCGVKVLRFSVGFGQALFRYVSPKSKIEYVIAAIPLGGYVKMLDEREQEVAEAEKHKAFNHQSVYARFAIVAAGPLANFIFAVFAYMMMYMVGVQGIKPEISQVQENTIAYHSGLQAGDVIVSVNDKPISTWEDLSLTIISEGLKTGHVNIEKIDGNGNIDEITMDLSDSSILVGDGNPISKIGISPWRPELTTRFGQFSSDSVAQAQGFLEGDMVLAANGQAVDGWMNWVDLVKSHPEKDIDVLILRDQQRLSMTLRPKAIEMDGEVIGRIGVSPWIDREALKQRQMTIKQDFLTAFEHGMTKTYDMSVLTVKLLGKLIIGEASTKNISGPISIAEFAGMSAQLGLASFLSTLAIISISIGILNLLPVPMLDGGHLMYYLIEMVKGSQVSEAIQLLGQKLGIIMLAGLMLLAFYNDIQRLFS